MFAERGKLGQNRYTKAPDQQCCQKGTVDPGYDKKKIINGFLQEVIDAFDRGDKIELRGFGTFFPSKIRKRLYLVPRTREERFIEECMTLKFKASKDLRKPTIETTDLFEEK